ncbi:MULTISPECIES: phosphoketolase [unclassified Agrococcus]|uniref:phosphoketolase family protein n=1 Tax=unclassified Agrococcus TaxID=2615065 RepID=UPI0036192679
MSDDLRPDLVAVDAWWRAANHLSAAQIYLRDDPLLRRSLDASSVKRRLLGHWGTVPGLNLAWAHLNRVIERDALDAIFVMGPGHGGPAAYANAWLEGTLSELEPEVGQDERGLVELVRRFSTPGGAPSHAAPEAPGSINEGGELGYSLVHAVGAALDDPSLLVACVIGDGEAETATLSASWQLSAILHPRDDGAVLPILHLNGWRIAGPTVLARMPADRLRDVLRGWGWEPIEVAIEPEDAHAAAHARFADALDRALDGIRAVREAPEGSMQRRPVIVLRSPKGWTGPAEVDGEAVEGTWRSHQVPLDGVADDADRRAQLERWLRSYRPQELFDEAGAPSAAVLANRPSPQRRMSASDRANGGRLRRALELPQLDAYAATDAHAGATRALGPWLRDVIAANRDFRLFGPDEVESNGLEAVFEVTDRQWQLPVHDGDEALGPRGQVVELLDENLMQGLLEGYLLTGRHGMLTSYEAFVHIVDAMTNQHAKWLESATRVPWRAPVSSLTTLLSSHVWRQDHNGFSHQDPGFLDVVLNKRPEIVRAYLPADANVLLATVERCLTTTDRVQVVVAGKHPMPVWLDLDEARTHLERGVDAWPWAGTEVEGEPVDAVLAGAGDVPTMEAIAAARLLAEHAPHLRIRVVDILDLQRLAPPSRHPDGLDDERFDALFTTDRPVILAFHGYPALVHRLLYRRTDDARIHVHGFREEGSTTTPFDMAMRNGLDRCSLAIDVLLRVDEQRHADAVARLEALRETYRRHAYEHGDDHADVAPTAFGRADLG